MQVVPRMINYADDICSMFFFFLKKALSSVKYINQPQHLNLAQHIVIHLAYFSPHDTPLFFLPRGRTKTHYAACRF